LFGDNTYAVVDLSQFCNPYDYNALREGLLNGSTAASLGARVTAAGTRWPPRVLVFANLEKADGCTWQALTALVGKGACTDTFGNNLDLNNTILFIHLTTHETLPALPLGTTTAELAERFQILQALLEERLKRPLTYDRLDWLDGIVPFDALGSPQIADVFQVRLKQFNEKWAEKEVEVQVTQQGLNFLIAEARPEKYGAHLFDRAIRELIEAPLGDALLRGSIRGPTKVIADARLSEAGDRTITLETQSLPASSPLEEPDTVRPLI
jgi:ATP-dependent Clp protease ATP-binding subunit ClpB